MLKRLFILILFSFLLITPAYAYDWLSDANIVAGWPMDTDEDPIDDETSNNYTIALKGDGEPDFATASPPAGGYSTGYYDWDGSDDYASTGNFTLSSNKCSVVFWFQADAASSGDDIIIEQSDNYNNYNDCFLIYFRSAENIEASAHGNVGYTYWRTSTTFTPGTWYHIGVTMDLSASNDEVEVFVNGVSDGALAGVVDNTNSFDNRPLYFGSRANNSLYCNMKIDEPAVFNDILTSTEINDIMDNGLVQAVAAGQIMRTVFY